MITKMTKTTFLFMLLLLATTSCISTKKLIYLQENATSDKEAKMGKINIQPYRVQSLDIISIILKAPDEKIVEMFQTSKGKAADSQESLYFNGFTVDDKGFIRIPVLGKVQVLGMTLDEIRIELERLLLKDYFNQEANVFVEVKLPGVIYTVNGEIGAPGANVVYKDRATILEAIANSGDINTTGDRKDVMIIRQTPNGAEIHNVDLTNRDIMNSPYYYIQSNDYIYIKPLKQKTWGVGVTGIQSFITFLQVFTFLSTIILLATK